MAGDAHAVHSAELYDAVGQIWLELFGEHVHVGFYPDGWPASAHTKSWQQAQLDHVDSVLEFAGVKRAKKVVDLGCGYGGTAVHIAQRLGCEAVGLNISPFQVQAANRLAERCGFPSNKVHFVVGDALKPDLPSATYDLVVSVESAAYMPDKAQFVQQLARLCAPGGTVVLVDFCRAPGEISQSLKARLASMDRIFATPGNWTSADEYKKMMESSGLKVERSANWTKNVCGFWNVGMWSLLLRSSNPKQSWGEWYKEFAARGTRVAWQFVTGGMPVLTMGMGYLLGEQKSVVQGGLDSGVLQYQIIVASKPAK